MPVVKAIAPERHFRIRELSSIDDDRWNGLKKHIPQNLTAEADGRLRSGVLECCSWFLTENDKIREARRTFAAMQELGRLAKGLRMAADAWVKIKEQPFHDDRVTDISRFDNLEAMAVDAERRFAALRAIESKYVVPPYEEFIRRVAKCCRTAGLKPTYTGRLYDYDDAATWFQKFVVALNRDLLGNEGPRRSASDEAEAAMITKAMRGDKKSGKARK
jgi:hypothetical protein